MEQQTIQTSKTGKFVAERQGNVHADQVRNWLWPNEVDKLMAAARRTGRHRDRDSTLILLTYRHGLRASEAVSLRWTQIDLGQGLIHVHRLKKGIPSTHPLAGSEIRALRKLKRQNKSNSPFVFITERGGPMTASNVRKMVARAGLEAGIELPVHPHMLRHATGFKLAADGQDTRAIQLYLGHRNIANTEIYTSLSPQRFNNFWRD